MFALLAVVTAVVGVVPLIIVKKVNAAAVTAACYFLVAWGFYYLVVPSLVWPLWGWVGFTALFYLAVSAFINVIGGSDDAGSTAMGWMPFAVVFAIFAMTIVGGCGFFRMAEYRDLIGNVENREWTKDVQPKDPMHVRRVPPELAYYLATKQLGEAPGAIGSQFTVSKEALTLQLVNNELWYVAPLEYRGFAAWTSKNNYAPGYVMVHGEDPRRQVVVKTGEKYRYMASAYLWDNLERYLWKNGYATKGLSDYSFEIDEHGRGFWVVTIFEPTVTWWGEKVHGVAVVEPTSGNIDFHKIGEVPAWVDRVVPREFTQNYIDWHGLYVSTWWNSVWAHENVIEPENPSIVYGSDGQPYWVTSVTSSNRKDGSMVGVFYTNSRTGETVRYHAIGGTEEKVVQLVDNTVSYRKWHGTSPVLYNIYGVMTSIVPVLGESHTYQGVAFVDVENMQVAFGETLDDAFSRYAKSISTRDRNIAPDKEHGEVTITVSVDRFDKEVRDNSTTYFIHTLDIRRIFKASADLSPKLPLTREGDVVVLRFIDSKTDTVLLTGFDNQSLPLDASTMQVELRQRVEKQREEEKTQSDVRKPRRQIRSRGK